MSNTGTYKLIDGKVIKISDDVNIFRTPIYGWKESDAGMYDDTFQCHVDSKDHYRQLLKSHGCRQKEDYQYCHKPSLAQRVKENLAKTRPVLEKAYQESLNKLSASEKEML